MNERMLARLGLLEQKKQEAEKLAILIDNLKKDINYALFPDEIEAMEISQAEVLMHELSEKWRNYIGLKKDIDKLEKELNKK